MNERAPIEMTMTELSALAGYTYRRMFDLNAELPEEKRFFVRGAGGKCLLDVFVQRWADFCVDRARGDDPDLEALKQQHEQVKLDRARMELDRLRGGLIDAVEVRSAWLNLAARVRQRMLELPAHLAPLLMGAEDEREITDIIDREVRAALTQLSDEAPLGGEEEEQD